MQTRAYSPLPLPHQSAFAACSPAGRSWPNAERASRRVLALPTYPHLADAAVERVVEAVREFAGRRPAPAVPTSEGAR